jgi:hypothetical protein
LVGFKCKFKTTHLNCAFIADLLGAVNLKKGLAGGADWEKQIGIGVTADGFVAPRIIGGTKGK